VKQGTDIALKTPQPLAESQNSLEAQVSDAGYERVQLQAKLADNAKTIDDLKHQLAEQMRVVNSLKTTKTTSGNPADGQSSGQQTVGASQPGRDAELSAAQVKLAELQKTVDTATAQRDENARQAATLEVRVNELTQLVRTREQALDQKE